MRPRPVLTILAVAGAVALGSPREARPQPAGPTTSAGPATPATPAAAAATGPAGPGGTGTTSDAETPPEPMAPSAWPKPAAGVSASGGPELLLTFDDGPSPLTTGRVLDILARHGVHGVFFLQGGRFERGDPTVTSALVARMLREGHVIANHTIDHARLCQVDAGARTHQIVGARAILERVSGVPVPWFRTPYGERCPELEGELARLGLKHFHWDIDPQEWRDRGPRYTAAKVIEKLQWLRGRAVLIMHDTKDTTTIALPKILEWIAFENRRRGKRGLRPIRLISGAQLASEQVTPAVAWLRRAGSEAATAVLGGLRATLP